jgi:hypothetical protein
MITTLPQRVLFFCDCNAEFDSLQVLADHVANCAAVSKGYSVREMVITTIENAIRNDEYSELIESDPFEALVELLAVYEYKRAQEQEPKDIDGVRAMLALSLKFAQLPKAQKAVICTEGLLYNEETKVKTWYELS